MNTQRSKWEEALMAFFGGYGLGWLLWLLPPWGIAVLAIIGLIGGMVAVNVRRRVDRS